MSKSVVVLLVAFLIGCANQPSYDRQAEIKKVMTSAEATCRAHLGDIRINSIRDRIPDQFKNATFEQLSESRRVQPNEILAVKVRAEVFLLCATEYRNALTRTDAAAPYLTAHDLDVNRIAGLYASLINGEIAYGQFLRDARASSLARQQAFQAINDAMNAEGAREAMRRIQAYQVWQSMQPVTCFRSGAYTTCQ